ncbi:MAG: DUF4173 domain-containing protein, partial [Chloroflexota bacterium]
MLIKRPNLFLWLTLVVAWFFDFLFWEKPIGISFLLFVSITVGVGLWLAKSQTVKPAWESLWLLVPIGFFSAMTFIRMEPLTMFLNIFTTLVLLGVFANSFIGGQWWRYTLKNYFTGGINLGASILARQIILFTEQKKQLNSPQVDRVNMKTFWSIVRGLIIALPILAIFSGLLSSADPIFEQRLENILQFFQIEHLIEYFFRGILILIIAYLLLGAFLHSIYKNHDAGIGKEEKPWILRFLGFTEASIILGSVVLLFASFVAIQFQYFFGGNANISEIGYTYSEYARRGFGELITVSLFSLFLFLGLSLVTKRESKKKKEFFSGLGILLVGLVGVMLVSSFQRLTLYEAIFGFSRLRAYSHVLIIWLGFLLLAVVILELRQKQQFFALMAVIACVGYGVSLNFLNVDGFIAKKNVARIATGSTLDIGYLASLSDDVVPILMDSYTTKPSSQIAGAIACHANRNHTDERVYTWQSFNLSRLRSKQIRET